MTAGIHCRGCSLRLQRVVVDFGANYAFGQVPKKLPEHYGINLPISTIRRVIVEIDEAAKDNRKNKTWRWQEARLSIVHEKGSVSPKFGAVFQGSVEEAEQCLLNAALLAGLGQQTQLYAVGDGAPWIAQPVDDKLGTQGSYLLDFYHVCEYLAAADPYCAQNETAKDWLETQQTALKNNEYRKVIKTLELYRETEEIEDSRAPVRAGYRYLSNRIEQLDYKTAIENELPIGSGEIESAHRYSRASQIAWGLVERHSCGFYVSFACD